MAGIENKLKHYKFVHIFRTNDLKFYTPFIDMINDESAGFNPEDHLFVVFFEEVYHALKDKGNVYYDHSTDDIYNRYAEIGDWVFSHGNPAKDQILRMKRDTRKKLVWRYWGGRKQKKRYITGLSLKNVAIAIYNVCYQIAGSYLFDHYRMIVIANSVDQIDLADCIRNTPLLPGPYARKGKYELVQELVSKDYSLHKGINVLIGHRAAEEEKHAYYIDLLNSRFPDKDIRLYVPLSYGEYDGTRYRDSIINHVKKMGYTNVEIMTDLIPYDDYCKLLNHMDVCLFDGEKSTALGNIQLLLLMKKKIFLMHNGVLEKAFCHEKLPFCRLDEIGSMSFEEFSQPAKYSDEIDSDLFMVSYEKGIEKWKQIFSCLEKNEGK